MSIKVINTYLVNAENKTVAIKKHLKSLIESGEDSRLVKEIIDNGCFRSFQLFEYSTETNAIYQVYVTDNDLNLFRLEETKTPF